MRTSRMQHFNPTPGPRTSSLRRLKTAFSPSGSASSSISSNRGSYAESTPRSAPSSCSSVGSSSPLESDCGFEYSRPMVREFQSIASRTEATGPVTGLGISNRGVSKSPERMGARQRLRAMLMRRRMSLVSKWDIRTEEQREIFSGWSAPVASQLMIFEPARKGEIAIASIFEVMESGRC